MCRKTQGPNNGQLKVQVFGSGFPQANDLKLDSGGGRIVPNEAVQILIDQATISGGISKSVQGYDNHVRIISENALEVRLFICYISETVLVIFYAVIINIEARS